MNGSVLVASLLAVSALGVARTQPRLAHVAHVVKENDAVYVLPPPSQLKAVALGYTAATVDLLWAKLLVEYGTRWHEKVEFHADPYVDTLIYLEPTYGPVYRFADTLLCYHPIHATEADARKARAVLERGTRERAWDYEIWIEYGQFSAFLGPGFLTTATPEEKDTWRREGAQALLKAVDLGAPSRLGVSAATVLQRSGGSEAEIQASIDALRRSWNMHWDDPDERAEIERKLQRLNAQVANERATRVLGMIGATWKNEWSFMTKLQVLLVAPAPDVARCAGPRGASEPACSHDWDTFLADPTAAPAP